MSFNYLKEYCRLMENTEVPPRFAIWTGIATLLAVLERRVWIPQGVYDIRPNFYMILIAASGQKKSTPIGIAEKLLKRLNPGPNIVSQKVSPEALINSVKRTKTDDSSQLLAERCGGIVIADELATFLDRGALDRGLGPILTKLYDCSDFEYQTLGRGTEKISGGYLSILGGTTVELLRNSLPKDAIGGGFTSRTLFVYEDKTAPPVAWVDYDEGLMELEERLVEYLQKLYDLKGTIVVEPEAKSFYIQDYNSRYEHSDFRKNPSLQGYENRRAAHLFKVAMALMVAEDPGLRLKELHIRGAKKILEEAESHLPTVMDLIIASELGAQSNQVFAFIKQKGEVSRTQIVQHFGSRIDALELAKILDTLQKADRIEYLTNAVGKLAYRPLQGAMR